MTPQKLLGFYERGVFATGEMVSRLCSLAADHDPASFVDQVPPELLADVREQSAIIPKPEEVLSVHGGTYMRDLTAEEQAAKEEREQQEKERFVAGLRAWKAYFDAQNSQG
jgi:hypothetical protein